MRVYLVRHGSAEPRGEDGTDRPERRLVQKGRKQCELVAGLFAGMRIRFERVLSSPYTRARETAEIVLQHMGLAMDVDQDERLIPTAPVSAALAAIGEQQSRCLLVVGHEPLLSELVANVAGYGTADLVLRKGGIVEMDLISRRPLRAELLGLIRPLHLRAFRDRSALASGAYSSVDT